MEPAYTELHCLSNFSFLRGASHPHELVERAIALGYAGLALTDECSFAGSARAHLAWREAIATYPAAAGFQLIHGTEIALEDGPRLVLLATRRAGWGNLCELVTLARRQAPKGRYRLGMSDIEAHLPLLDDCLALWLPPAAPGAQDLAWARWVRQVVLGRAWIACELLRGPDDDAQLARLRGLSAASRLPLVAAGGVLMHARARQRLADVLAAIRLKTPLAAAGTALAPNAEAHLRPLYRVERIYPADLLEQTQEVARRCRFALDELRYEYPEEIVPPGVTPTAHLRALTQAAAARRYPQGVPARVSALIEHELAVIAQLGYEPYFLTVLDIVEFARSRGILCQGRGSAANSAVCFCLGITAVDPARSQVLFERFISPERREPPDIDVDFEHERREEVMQYLFAKYGRHRAALTGALHTYHPRGALRDVAKALGLPLDAAERLAKSMSRWDGRRIDPQRLAEAGFDPDSAVLGHVVEHAQTLLGFPRHLSQHSGGFVLARDRLDRLVPIENAAMPGRTVIQWDKDDLEALGLLKVDVLALGMLSLIRRAFEHIQAYRAQPRARFTSEKMGSDSICLQDIPDGCAATYDLLCAGDTLGVFQVESRAQMAMLPRLRPRCFYDLVIETAIVRPGPIQGGMVHPYLRRRQGLEPVTYPSPAVQGVLERTLGVSIFQEQVMQLAVVAAGFTPGEADQLRRAMAAWKRKGGIGPFRDKLLRGMVERGYTLEYAEQIDRQIQGFGEYGFPESHAASFALLVYNSAWLKCHEPAAFYAALLDCQPLGFYSPAQIVQDAQRHGLVWLPVDVTASNWLCQLVPCPAGAAQVRLGLKQVAGLGEAAAQRIAAARAAAAFGEAEDLARRARLTRAEMQALARADALATLAGHRRAAVWQCLGIDAQAPQAAPLAAHSGGEAQVELLPPGEGEAIVADYMHTALSLRRHPLALLRPGLAARGLIDAAGVAAARPRQLVRACGLVTCRQRPGTASGVTFVTLEDETGVINVVVWRDVAERWRRELIGARLLTVYGRVEKIETPGAPLVHLIAQRLVDHSELLAELLAPAPLKVDSHDFH